MSNIPIVIINRDRLSTTKRLVEQLTILDYKNITILDMDSSYEPLLQWYKDTDIPLIKAANTTHKALWHNGIIDRFNKHQWIAVTDSDIELHPDTLKEFIEQMITTAKGFGMDKAGLAIQFNNIPNSYLSNIIRNIESRYWKVPLTHPTHTVFSAAVDTSFCVVRTDRPFMYPAIRIADWPCIHTPWYEDWDNLTEEQQYYLDHCDERIGTIKQHYLAYKQLQTEDDNM